MTVGDLAGAPATINDPLFEQQLEHHRLELTGYCYRMLGSAADAEDAVQDAIARAWRAADRFEGRSSVRTWLYRIATNVCLDVLRGRQRRALPMDLGPASTVATAELTALPDGRWLEPVPDGRVIAPDTDPAERVIARESLRLAFIAALQHLPPRQRAALVLFDVLRWSAGEIAELLDTSVPAVNSALQRARATLSERSPVASAPIDPLDEEQRELLERYLDAFERYDMIALTALLHEDATQSMPPYELWLQGRDEVVGWMLGPGSECAGSRLVPTVANGMPAFGQYRPAASGRGHDPWALQIVEVVDGAITGLNAYLDTQRWFPMFDLPDHLPGDDRNS